MSSAQAAALILFAFDTSRPGAERNESARTLGETIERQAGRVAHGDRSLREELIGHAWVQLGRGMYAAAPGASFEAWLLTLMRHYRADAHRYRIRRPVVTATMPEQAAPPTDPAGRDLRIDLTTPFAAADASRVGAWTVPQRIVLLPWWLLWQKVAPEFWGKTVRAAGLSEAFPDPDFAHFVAEERTAYLADSLCVTRNAITQTLCREGRKVRALRFVRELMGTE